MKLKADLFLLPFDPKPSILLFSNQKNSMIKMYGNIIVPSILYRCENWPLKFKADFRLRVFEVLRCGAVVWATTLQTGRIGFRFPMGSLWFSLTKSFQAHYVPGVDSAPTRNEFQGILLGVKAAGVMAENLASFMCQLSRISGGSNIWIPYELSRFLYRDYLS